MLSPIRAYAVPDYVGKQRGSMQIEYCVVPYQSLPSAYVHELLHLFGADDYYSEYSQTLDQLKCLFIFQSVMFYGGWLPLDELAVDDLTAQNIGWL